MSAVWMRLRAELRGRWRAWLGLATLIGLSGGLVLACAAGARRTDSAFDRFLVAQRSADASTFYVAWDPSFAKLDPDQVEALPSVAESVRGAFVDLDGDTEAFASTDARFGVTFGRLKMLEGRRPDPNVVDEVSVPYASAAALGARVGGTITITPHLPGPNGDEGAPVPMVVKVVGIHITAPEFPPDSSSGDQPRFVVLTPAFHREHASRLLSFGTGFFRLKGGTASYGAFLKEVEGVAGGKPFFVIPQSEQTAIANASVHQIALALWTFAALLAVVLILVLGQTLARQIFVDSDGFAAARALGMTGGQLFTVGIARAVVIGAGAGLIAVATAFALSPIAPISIARLVEPFPGFRADVFVLALGMVAILGAVTLLSAYPAYRAERAVAQRTDAAPRRSRVARAASRVGLPPAAVAGVRLALERGGGRSAVPVRTTIGGATIGIAALLMSFTFAQSLNQLLASPELYGVRWDRVVTAGGFDRSDVPGMTALVARITAVPGVEQAAIADDGIPFVIDGVEAAGLGIAPDDRDIAPPILAGRFPRAASEIALGEKTLAATGRRIGDDVTVGIQGLPSNTFRVVGTVAMPGFSVGSSLGEGAVVPQSAVERFLDSPPVPETIFVRFAPDARPAAVAKVIEALPGVASLAVPKVPPELVNLGRVSGLPSLMAGVLALLAAAAIGHSLISGVRRRARDLAILKALGFVRGQVRTAVAWQATTLMVLSLVIGIPVGIGAGRWLWALAARALGIVSSPVVPSRGTLALVPLAIIVAVAVSALPARTAARTRPGDVLRAL